MKSDNNNHLWQVWDREADTWDRFIESGGDITRLLIHGPGMLELCLPAEGLKILDIGCGQGFFSRELARQGAKVTAFDFSPNMIKIAKEKEAENPLGIEYLILDAEKAGELLEEESYDKVTACMSVMDIQNPFAAIKGAAKVLKTGGNFIFSIPHPCTDTKLRKWHKDAEGKTIGLTINYYFEAGMDTFNWVETAIGKDMITPFHRFTLTQWSEMLYNSGLSIKRIREPKPDENLLAEKPGLSSMAKIPYFMVFETVKI
ncbi:MAG: class I SAM-dependent methyltransferase [Firmicutes bacterium]|nr:class I SAM-dependent methyltransferase [Bacillota bacterium]